MDHEIKQVEVEAYLYSKQEPTPQQQERLKQFLEDYHLLIHHLVKLNYHHFLYLLYYFLLQLHHFDY